MPHLRSYRPTDDEALAEVCLRTADAGADATGLLPDDDLWAEIFVLPYVARHPDLAFVVVDDDDRAIGYIVGTDNTREFEEWFASEWWPRFADRWPAPDAAAESTRETDILRYAYNLRPGSDPHGGTYPAHLHIDLLPGAQGQGWGRFLITAFTAVLRERGIAGVHFAANAENSGALAFYDRLGFDRLDSERGEQVFGQTVTPGARPVAVVAGASGFIGSALTSAFESDGYEVRRIGRSAETTWDTPAAIARAVDGADVLVNLAGKSVNARYTDVARDEILRSRVDTTRALREAIAAVPNPPRVWLNASTATIYRHEEVRANTESSGVIGEGFSVDVARSWEQEFFAGDLPHTRRVALRMAIVVGDGSATASLLRLARVGLGGPQIDSPWFRHRRYRGIGDDASGLERSSHHRTRGAQKFSWIHIDDVVAATRFLIERPDISGPVNLASPELSDNRTFMRELREVVGMPFGLPAWRWMLEPAMWVLRTEPELVLKSRWVVPETLTDAGFEFTHPQLRAALEDAVARRS
ncbi:NAD dependent epimerase/dehydratase family enzyme/ribosomal protein S18 acetylase RimI-like enzyme [Microbacterium endophyticum]|uniref:NAD dependent epimerase/dehydratase family enzyme/ribosomal protein S18 acetylase RimI-like enzyme n=1 Tax=Microbacterium endophyticum TaxID=1526412 RepID=A0A7W4V313_9MICO|nr:NAD dependent epimerase/dehydratase family enzyme/ribosomal protein S18 acetylase RimI-like enzyme [Microbacterium endophyticum]MBB2976572.1 NAD dependent epimerase/dehydratase family enzyme/ribosomal protein S18 acetylase RimI-like enzyme [Microbacterium endophyticum]NIK37545.1 NAD dependent epimerase/dehydratase family enzyme/ribosomal protein S18 acetylase RimI-like enzyme [Microbacterium endophyticum]